MNTRKVTTNFYADDCDRLRQIYGYGWSAQLKEIIHSWVKAHDQRSDDMRGVRTDVN